MHRLILAVAVAVLVPLPVMAQSVNEQFSSSGSNRNGEEQQKCRQAVTQVYEKHQSEPPRGQAQASQWEQADLAECDQAGKAGQFKLRAVKGKPQSGETGVVLQAEKGKLGTPPEIKRLQAERANLQAERQGLLKKYVTIYHGLEHPVIQDEQGPGSSTPHDWHRAVLHSVSGYRAIVPRGGELDRENQTFVMKRAKELLKKIGIYDQNIKYLNQKIRYLNQKLNRGASGQ